MDIKYPEGNVRANGIVLIGTKVSVNERERENKREREKESYNLSVEKCLYIYF